VLVDGIQYFGFSQKVKRLSETAAAEEALKALGLLVYNISTKQHITKTIKLQTKMLVDGIQYFRLSQKAKNV